MTTLDLSQWLPRVRSRGSLACSECGTVLRCKMDESGLIYLRCRECNDYPIFWMGMAETVLIASIPKGEARR